MLVLAVGEQSEWGRTMALVVGEAGETPLQEKLGWLATAIGKLGFTVALICFIVLLVRWAWEVFARGAEEGRGGVEGSRQRCSDLHPPSTCRRRTWRRRRCIARPLLPFCLPLHAPPFLPP
jgi:hypothetical protein